MQKFRLKEYTGLENYCWEKAFLTYKLCDEPTGNVLCLSENGEKIPFQIIDKGNGEYFLSFVSSLNSGEEKEYFFAKSITEYQNVAFFENGATVLENENIKVKIGSDTNSLFTISYKICDIIGKAELTVPVVKKSVKILENGAVFATVKVLAELENGDTYEIAFRLVKEQEFVTLTESIKTSGCSMRISWQNFNVLKRVSPNTRCEQYIDEYLKPNNEIPVVLLPHDVTNGVVECTNIAFFNNELSVGAFIGDSIKWDDGSYSIQSNNKINALRFYYYENAEDKLVWEYPLNIGSRETCIALYKSEKNYNSMLRSHIRELQFWNYYLPLDLYKDWIFDYDDRYEVYPKYFDINRFDLKKKYNLPTKYEEEGIPPGDEVLKIITDCDAIKNPWSFGPMKSRVFGDIIPILDLRVNEMSREDFKNARTICILFAYYAMNENTFPTRHTLAGHANFCMDYVSIVGFAAAMFPHHPHAKVWKDYYHRAVLLNMKFYIRPDVKAWNAKGGRSTENLGCYSWAGLRHIIMVGEMLENTYGDNPALCKNFVKWADWLLNSLSSPINDRRAFPPLGAHAGGHTLNPYYPTFWFRVMGNMLKNYSPLLSEQILNVCPSEPLVQFECFDKNDVWSYLNINADPLNNGIKPHLKSKKFTGYGYVMRSHVNEKNEMCVLLQQIDEGPNYRWGISCSGGCGNIYYYADNKRFSDNRKEDVGDDVMADGDVSCTFAVLQGKTYTSVGKNELTYPLFDFGFCQYARVNAGEYSSDEYNYRSVLMADNDYIAIYDSVRDYRTQGRFSWFSNVDDEMPYIHQIKPGLEPREVLSPDRTVDGREYNHRANGMEIPYKTRGVMFDGRGDFFTVVTHKKDLQIEGKEYGAIVKKKNSTDYIFDAPYRLNVCEKDVEFVGKVGFVRVYKNNEYDLAVFEGKFLRVYQTEIKIERKSQHFSISLSKRNGRLFGKCEGCANVIFNDKDISMYKLFVNSEPVDFTCGRSIELNDCEWELTIAEPTPSSIENISYCENEHGVEITWNCKNCNDFIVKVDDREYFTKDTNLNIELGTGKYIVCIYVRDDTGQCIEYPVYITRSAPGKVEGLLVTRHRDFVDISWGEQLGVKQYNLYRVDESDNIEKIYTGKKNAFEEKIKSEAVKYFVTAENGIGEGEPSILRDISLEGMSVWDPLPDIEFLRDTVVNEHGYPGFDYKYNENRKILKYPE